MARRCGPAQPRGVTWNGAGGSLIFSQSRHVIFSRTCWITFHWRGITSSVSVIGLAELPQPCAAAARACRRSRHDDTLSRQVRGERLSGRALAREGGDRCRLRGCPLGGDLVLGGGRFQLREIQLHLVEDARRALRARSVDLALELGDLELLLRDHRRIVGRLGAGHRQLCLQCLDVVGLRIHAHKGITDPRLPPAKNARQDGLSRTFRPECVNRVTPVDPVEHVGELRGRNRDAAAVR